MNGSTQPTKSQPLNQNKIDDSPVMITMGSEPIPLPYKSWDEVPLDQRHSIDTIQLITEEPPETDTTPKCCGRKIYKIGTTGTIILLILKAWLIIMRRNMSQHREPINTTVPSFDIKLPEYNFDPNANLPPSVFDQKSPFDDIDPDLLKNINEMHSYNFDSDLFKTIPDNQPPASVFDQEKKFEFDRSDPLKHLSEIQSNTLKPMSLDEVRAKFLGRKQNSESEQETQLS